MARDLTKGGEAKGVFLFALPIMAGQLLQQLYNTVDSIVVGRYIGETALSAVGTCAPVTFFFVAFAMGLSNGAGVLFAQYYGGKLMDELRKAFSTAALLLLIIGAGLTVIGVAGAKLLLGGLLSVPPEILGNASAYFMIYCSGLIFQFIYNAVAAALRSVGDSRATLLFLLISSVLNVILDLLFVIQFNMGVIGTAIATVISQAVSAAVSVFYMQRKYAFYRYKKGEFVFSGQMCGLTLKFGVPTMVQMCIVSGSQVLIQRVANGFGTAAIAAATAAGRIENYIFIPAQSFNNSIATFTGQNVGANNFDRVYRGYRKTLLMSVPICLALMAGTWIFAKPLVGLFGVQDEALGLGIAHLRFMAPFFLVFALYMPTAGVLTGSGDVYSATGITLSGLAIRVISVYMFAYVFKLGFPSLYYAIPIGWALCLVAGYIRYRSGKWKTKRIVRSKPTSTNI